MTALSHQVVDLNSVLNDKQSHGTFGKVQLSALSDNMIPKHYALQSTLSTICAPIALFTCKAHWQYGYRFKIPLRPIILLSRQKMKAPKKTKRLFKQSIKNISKISKANIFFRLKRQMKFNDVYP